MEKNKKKGGQEKEENLDKKQLTFPAVVRTTIIASTSVVIAKRPFSGTGLSISFAFSPSTVTFMASTFVAVPPRV